MIIDFFFPKEGTLGSERDATGRHTATMDMDINWDCPDQSIACVHLNYGALVWQCKKEFYHLGIKYLILKSFAS